jgi:AraC-like DNA-binding protein
MILALLPSAELRLQRLRAAVGEARTLVPCESWSELTAAAQRGGSATELVVFDLYADGTPDFERVRLLHRFAPRAALVAYVDVARGRLVDAFDAGRAGIDAFVIAGEGDGADALGELVARATARGASALVRPALAGVRPSVRDAVLLAVTRAHERLTPEALARRVAVSRRALTRRLEDAGLPPPHALLTWGRLLVAARLLEDSTRSAADVATSLDFPSPSAFRLVSRRPLDTTPGGLPERGRATWLAGLLLSAVARRP